jgi:hypothetical protein
MKNHTSSLFFILYSLFFISFANGQDFTFNSPNGEITLSNTTFEGNVYVGPLTTVIVPEGVIIKLKSAKFLEVMPSAKLIVKGLVTYDNSDPSVPLFNQYFYGIRVIGIPEKSSPGIQTILNGGFPWGNAENNGALIIDGGSILYANSAIVSVNGGIIYVNNAEIGQYRSFGMAYIREGVPLQQISSRPTLAIIKNSEFTNNQYLDNLHDYGINAIDAWFINGINISNCEFIDATTNPQSTSIGLSFLQTGSIISNCTFSNFKDYAIFSQKYLSSIKGYITIRNCQFDNCKTGVYLRGEELTQIHNNTFYCPNSGKNIGIELWGSNAFNIRQNIFHDYGKSLTDNGYSSQAIAIESSGDMGNMVRNNDFFDCVNGVIISEDNRGLQLKCNKFNSNTISASINFTSRVTKLTIPQNKRGISDQGGIFPGDNFGRYLPGNLFSQSCQFSSECDFYISPNHPVVKYYYYYSASSTNLTYPEYHTQNLLLPRINLDAQIEYLSSGCAFNFENFPDIITRKNDAKSLKEGLIPYAEIDTIQKKIDYLEDYIEVENANILWHVLNNEETDSIYDFLKNDVSLQSKLWLAALYIDDNNYDSAYIVLNQISITDQTSYHYLNQQYLLKIVNHFRTGYNLCNFSEVDKSYFESMVNSYSPIAFRSNILLDLMDSICTTNELLSSTRNLVPKNKLKANIIIGPKPSFDFINIQANYAGSTYKIINLTGQKVKGGIINSDAKLSILDINDGIYQLLIYNPDGSISSDKFIKSN